MKTESQLIENISGRLPRSPLQVNQLFESDAEILKSGEGYLLYSVDDYSKEDHFRTTNPFILGRNLAIATISDIYASGGVPEYYLHSVVLNSEEWSNSFMTEFSAGVGKVLKEAGAFFLGGDLGLSNNWHYTATVTGRSHRVLTRKGTKPGETILITGTAGAGNTEAAISIFNLENHFPSIELNLRKMESELISRFATTCIDTSDGVVNSLNIISELNKTGYEITSCRYHPLSKCVVENLGVPDELLLLGECGEYELLFTIDTNNLADFFTEAEEMQLQFTSIGNVTTPDEKILLTSNGLINLLDFNIRGRDFAMEEDYIASLIQYLKSHGINKYSGIKK